MKKKTNLPRFKGAWNIWKYVTSPGPYYYGGALHYVNKEGRFVHAKYSETHKDIKPKTITKTEFNKMFGHLLKDKEYMKFINNHKI